MRYRLLFFLPLLAALFVGLKRLVRYYLYEYAPPVKPAPPGTTRVACVGDSITFGVMIWRRSNKSYPAVLQRLLGESYAVRNFGVNGHSLQKSAELPYWQHPNLTLSSAYNPDIVLIMLGTNDSIARNWRGIAPFIEDYRELIAHYRALPAAPRIYLMTPPSLFTVRNNSQVMFEMSREAVGEMTAAIQGLGREEGLPVIDINAATANRPDCFPLDGVHPGAAGARLIAETVYAALTRHTEPTPPA